MAKRVPMRELPNFLVRLASLRDSAVKQIIPELGIAKNASNEKARRVLGWTPRSNEDSIVATAESLLRLGTLEREQDGPSLDWIYVRKKSCYSSLPAARSLIKPRSAARKS